MSTLARRTGTIAAASLLGIGLVGVGAAPAFAVTVSDTATLNAAIIANEPVLDLSASFALTADIETIDYDVTINGNGFTIDADGFDAFDIVGSATVSNLTVTDALSEAFYLILDVDGATFTNVSASESEYGILGDLYGDAVLNVTGGTFSALEYGIDLNDENGDASVAVSGTTFTDTYRGIQLDDAIGTTSLAVTGVSITDAYWGVYFAGEDESSVALSLSTITAGPEHNSSGDGYGIYTYHYDDSTATVDGVTVAGDPDAAHFGTGYESTQNDANSVVIANSTFTGSETGLSIDVYSNEPVGYFALLNSRVTNSNEYGVYFSELAGTGVIDQTTIDDNGHDSGYAAVDAYVYGEGTGNLTISRSTISNQDEGPALEVEFGDDDTAITVVNSTISNNALDDYSAIYVEGNDYDGAQFSLLNSTVTANTETWAALQLEGVEATVSNSILSANELSDNAEAEVYVEDDASLFLEYSLVGSVFVEDGGVYTEGAGVKLTSAPGLGPLAENGGPTLTHALLVGSPALNAGNPAIVDPPETDQRGDARIVQGRIDIGAVEMPAALANTGSVPAPVLPVALLLVLLGGAFLVLRRRTA